jgi:hypothetical protein
VDFGLELGDVFVDLGDLKCIFIDGMYFLCIISLDVVVALLNVGNGIL